MPSRNGKSGGTVAIILGPEFEATHVFTLRRVLSSEGHDVLLIGEDRGERLLDAEGQTAVETHRSFRDIEPTDLDCIILPGGNGTTALRANPACEALLRDFGALARPLGTIGRGARVLIPAGLVPGRRCTADPGIWAELQSAGATVVDGPLVIDGHWISGRVSADLALFEQAIQHALRERFESAITAPYPVTDLSGIEAADTVPRGTR